MKKSMTRISPDVKSRGPHLSSIHYPQSMKSTTAIISPAETAKWTRGASNAGYHYLGCAKTFALMGKTFAEADLEMMRGRP